MAWFRKHRLASQQQGRPISAQDLRHAGETLDWIAQIQAAPPLELLSTVTGPLLRYPGMLFEVYIAVTTTTISARSGGTPGSGTVKVQTWDGSALADLAGPVTFTALNISAATGGIASGKYCIVIKIASAYWIVTAEC
jgi:hypothetical protein